MKRLYYSNSGFELKDIAEPEIKREDDVKIKIAYAAFCGSDMRLAKGLRDDIDASTPVTVGHEASGYVAGLGPKATEKGLKIGDKVVFNFMKYCNKCKFCREGHENMCINATGEESAMSEYVVVSEQQVFKLSDDADMRKAALIEPISVGLRAITRCEIKPGQTVAIFGGGSIGQFMIQLAKYSGASRITLFEPVERKRQIALSCGADYVVDPINQDPVKEAEKITDGYYYDVVIESSGAPVALKSSYAIVGRGGTLTAISIYSKGTDLGFLDMNYNFNNKREITIKTSFQSPYLFGRTAEFYTRMDLDPFITNIYEPEDFAKAIEDQKTDKCIKSIIKFSD